MIRTIASRFLAVTVPTLALCLAGSEIFFRTVAPACQAPLVEYDSSSTGCRPRIAIIGDSYVEGLHVDVSLHVDAVLRSEIGPGSPVYAFGMSGAPLSQYLLMSRYVARKFDPDVMIFVLVHNDFAQSLRDLEEKPYYLQLRATPDGFTEVPPREYRSRPFRRLLSRSATVRFLILNAKLAAIRPRDALRPSTVQAELDRASASKEEICALTRHILGLIRAENPTRRILFTMVPERIERGGERPNEAKAAWLHAFVREAAAECGCGYIDLDGAFNRRFLEEGAQFNFDEDSHWNALGHETAARSILAKLMEMGIVRHARSPQGPEIVRSNGPVQRETVAVRDANGNFQPGEPERDNGPGGGSTRISDQSVL